MGSKSEAGLGNVPSRLAETYKAIEGIKPEYGGSFVITSSWNQRYLWIRRPKNMPSDEFNKTFTLIKQALAKDGFELGCGVRKTGYAEYALQLKKEKAPRR